jgi:hypothetical protein
MRKPAVATHGLWQKTYSFTSEQFKANPYIVSAAVDAAKGEHNAEIKRLVVLVFDTRVNDQKEKSTSSNG